MVDLFLFQNPLASAPAAFTSWLPGHFPVRLALEAALTDQIRIQPVLGSLGALALITAAAATSFVVAVRAR